MDRNKYQRQKQQESQAFLKIRNKNVAELAKTPSSQRGSDQPDPEIVHHYDNFYHTTKSLLILFQIMGVMPIERQIGRTTYR